MLKTKFSKGECVERKKGYKSEKNLGPARQTGQEPT